MVLIIIAVLAFIIIMYAHQIKGHVYRDRQIQQLHKF